MIPRRSPVALCLSLLSIAGCGKEEAGPGNQTPCVQGPMEVEVGTGQTSFVAMPGGADLPFYMGPQGGFHVWGSVRARGYTLARSSDPNAADQPEIRFQLLRGNEVIAGSVIQHRELAPADDGWRSRAGAFVIFGVPAPLALEAEAVSLEVRVTDRCQLVGTDARGGVLRFSGAAPGPP